MIEQWKKGPWLFKVYRDYATQFYGDLISHYDPYIECHNGFEPGRVKFHQL